MSEVPIDGDQAPDDDDAIEGRVLPFPGAAPVPVRPQRGEPGEWKAIIPEHLRTRAGITKAASWHYRRARHHALYHGVRSPGRLLSTLRWALVGLARIAFAEISWWWVSEEAYLRHTSIAAGDVAEMAVAAQARSRGAPRARPGAARPRWSRSASPPRTLTAYFPLGWIPLAAVAVPVLAWIGRPDDKPIMTSAVVPDAPWTS